MGPDMAGGIAEAIQDHLDGGHDEILMGRLSAWLDCHNEVHVALTPWDPDLPTRTFCVVVTEM